MSKKNEDTIIEICNTQLGDAFVLTAIEHYAKEVLADGLESWGDKSFISKDYWLYLAERSLEIVRNENIEVK